MKKSLQVLAFIILITNSICAQNTTSTAFYNSYTNENTKNYEKAIQALTAVYSESSYDINLRLGWLYYMQGEYNNSQNKYKQAIKIAPKSIEAKFGLIYPLTAIQNWNEVLKVYEQIIAIDSNNSKANYNIAYIYYVRKDFNKANSFANKVYNLYPFDYDTNLLLGRINISLGNILEAKKHLNKALNFSPTSLEVINLLKTL